MFYLSYVEFCLPSFLSCLSRNYWSAPRLHNELFALPASASAHSLSNTPENWTSQRIKRPLIRQSPCRRGACCLGDWLGIWQIERNCASRKSRIAGFVSVRNHGRQVSVSVCVSGHGLLCFGSVCGGAINLPDFLIIFYKNKYS